MTFRVRALLFDLDGTLIDSLPAVDRAWRHYSELRGLNPDEVLPQIHGRRSIDSLRALVPHLDVEAEDRFLRHLETNDTAGVTALPGALAFLRRLEPGDWLVVTSGTSDVAIARMRAAGIPVPPHGVYGEDVTRGKPAPDPFLAGAARLGVSPSECLVFEDTLAGVQSAKAAGMQAVCIGSAGASAADASIDTLAQVELSRQESMLTITVN